MKILKLHIRNMASIVETFIDFTAAPLSEDSIFLITGETGSGKTTILNCICIALYNEVPSLKAYASCKPDGKLKFNTNSTFNLIRLDGGQASITLEFVGNDGKNYEISWLPQYYSRKGKHGIKGELMTSGQNLKRILKGIGEGNDFYSEKEIQPKIHELVGLTFDQFCRTTMLAQGQFLKFLTSKNEDKTEILEKMTGTEIYAKVGAQIFKISKDYQDDLRDLQLAYDAAALLSPTQRQEKQDIIAKDEEESKKLGAEEAKASEAVSWLSQLETRTKALMQVQEELKSFTSEEKTGEIKALELTIRNWEETADFRKLLTDIKDALDLLNKKHSEIEKKKTEFKKFCSALAFLRKELAAIDSEINDLDTKIEAESPRLEMYKSADLIYALIDNIISRRQKISQCQDNISNNTETLSVLAENIRGKQEAIEKAKAELDILKDEADKLDKEASGFDIKQISEDYDAANAHKTNAAAAINALRNLNEKQSELAATESKKAEAINALEEATANLENAIARQSKAKTECDQALARYRGQMDLRDKIAELTTIFAEEKKCPLCGSDVEHLHTKDVINKAVEEAKKVADAAMSANEDAIKLVSDLKASVKSLNSSIKDIEKDLANKSKAFDNARNDYQAAIEKLGFSIPTPTMADDLQYFLTKDEEKLAKLAEIRNRANIANENYKKKQREYNKQLDELNKKREDAEADGQKKTKLESQIENEKANIESLKQEIASTLAVVRSLLPLSAPETQPLLCQNAPEEDLLCNLDNAKLSIAELKGKYDALCSRLSDAKNRKDETERNISRVASGLASIDQICGPIDDDVAPAYMKGVEANTQIFVNSTFALAGEIKTCEEKLSYLNNKKAAWLEGKDQDSVLAVIDSLAGETSESISAKRKRAADYKEELAKIKGSIITHQAELDNLHKAKPNTVTDELTLEQARENKTVLEEAVSALKDKIAKDKAELAHDDDLQKKNAGIKAKIDKLKPTADKWSEIADTFGDATGKKFRTYAQSYLFINLVRRANEYLRLLTPRYELEAEYGNLLVYVIDHNEGDARRLANSLSGGEGFIASLALALGLSEFNNKIEQVDTLFIDEGFGTLSSDVLPTVVDMLCQLHTETGRRVAVISHMDYLKEQIPTQIQMSKVPGTSRSEVKISTF